MDESSEQKRIRIPPILDKGEEIVLPTSEVRKSYAGSEFEFYDFRYGTDINKDPAAHQFIVGLINEIHRERVRLTRQWKQEGSQEELPSFEEVARQAVQKKFPKYSEPLDPNAEVVDPAVAEAIANLRDAIVAEGGKSIGDLIAADAVVCLEQSIILHAIYNEHKTANRLVIADFGYGSHVWVEYFSKYRKQYMVADAVWGFNLPVDQAMERYGHPKVIFKQVMGQPKNSPRIKLPLKNK